MELFKILKIQLTIPLTYKITDYNGEVIQGSFLRRGVAKNFTKHVSYREDIKEKRR